MKTNDLLQKAFNSVYSFRMNAYVEEEALIRIYAQEMKNYCEKKGHSVHYEDAYDFAYEHLHTEELDPMAA